MTCAHCPMLFQQAHSMHAPYANLISLPFSLSLSCSALVEVMFGQPSYAFTEDGVMGEIKVTASAPAPFNFSFSVNGGKLLYTLE